MSTGAEEQQQQEKKIAFEKGTVEWDGRRMGLVYGVPSAYSSETPAIVIAHGAGGPMFSPFISFFHGELARRGFLTIKFNFPYMEARRRFPDKADILEESFRRIVDHARNDRFHPKRFFLGGKSMGGRIASQAVTTRDIDGVNGLFFFGYPLHPPGRVDKLRDNHLYRVHCPMLFISGTKDNFARRDLLQQTVDKLAGKAKIHWIDGGDHSLDRGRGKGELAQTYSEVAWVLEDWLRSFADT